jgi:hypothetical protein
MPIKTPEEKTERQSSDFAFRIKIGDYEIEIKGTYEEVTRTIENLSSLVINVQKAFENVKPKTIATLTVKTEPAPKQAQETPAKSYPKIVTPATPAEAVVRILKTDWGKWRPRTVEELKEAIKENDLKYPSRTLTETLSELAEKGRVRRWNTNTGFVYILAEKDAVSAGEEQQ